MFTVKAMSRIYRRGKKGIFTYEGYGVKKSLKTNNESIAIMLQRQWDEKLERSVHGLENPNITWGEYKEEYYKLYLQEESSARLMKSIVGTFEQTLEIKPQAKISSIRMVDCEKWLAMRLGQVAPQTVDAQMGYLRPFFDKAVKRKYIDSSPFEGIDMPDYHKPEAKCLGVSESALFLDALPKREPEYEMIGLFLYDTGFRVSEVVHQRMEDIDFISGTINVRIHDNRCVCHQCEKRATAGKKRGWFPKNKNERAIPLSSRILSMLLKLYQERQTGCAFPLRAGTITTNMRHVYEAAGIKGKCGSHTLRHTLNNDMRRAGVEEEVRKAIMGHGKTSTNQIYTHVSFDEMRAAMKMLWEWRTGAGNQMVAHLK